LQLFIKGEFFVDENQRLLLDIVAEKIKAKQLLKSQVIVLES
jgi:hypothetical protein